MSETDHDIECLYRNRLAAQYRCRDCGERATDKDDFSECCEGDGTDPYSTDTEEADRDV